MNITVDGIGAMILIILWIAGVVIAGPGNGTVHAGSQRRAEAHLDQADPGPMLGAHDPP